MKKRLTILFLYLPYILFAQSDNWRVFSSSNTPLPNNKITSTTIDHNNIMYFGTHEGLIVFDGDKWKKYNTEIRSYIFRIFTSLLKSRLKLN